MSSCCLETFLAKILIFPSLRRFLYMSLSRCSESEIMLNVLEIPNVRSTMYWNYLASRRGNCNENATSGARRCSQQECSTASMYGTCVPRHNTDGDTLKHVRVLVGMRRWHVALSRMKRIRIPQREWRKSNCNISMSMPIRIFPAIKEYYIARTRKELFYYWRM